MSIEPNALQLGTSGASGDFILQYPTVMTQLHLAAFTGNGNGLVNVVVTFSDSTTEQVGTNFIIRDWFGGSSVVYTTRGRVSNGGSLGALNSTNPRIYTYGFNISAANQSKPVTKVTITKVGGTGRSYFFGLASDSAPVTPTASDICQDATEWLVPINIGAAISNLGSADLVLDYDTSKLAYDAIYSVHSNLTNAALDNSQSLQVNDNNGKITISWSDSTGISINDTLLTLKFIPKNGTANFSGIAGQTTDFTWDVSTAGNCEFTDSSGSIIPTVFNNQTGVAVGTLPTFSTNIVCSGDTTSSVTIMTSGGIAPYQYSTDNGMTFSIDSVLTGLAAGTYQVVVKDAIGCMSAVQTVTVSTCLIATFIANSACPNSSVFVTTTGGTAPYSDGTNTYQTDTFTISGLSAGAFSYTITDSLGKSTTISDTIVNPVTATFAIDNTIDVSCNGENDGSITILQQSSVINEIISSTDGLNEGNGVAVDNAGNVYVAGAISDNVYKIEPNGTKTQVISLTNGLNGPTGVAVDNAGNAYVAGFFSDDVHKIEPNGTITKIISSADGLNAGIGVAVDNAGNVYVSGYYSDNVYKIEPNGTKTQIISAADGLNEAVGVAVDNAGNVYVAGANSDNVYKIEPNGTKTQIITSADGLNGPSRVAVDNAGNVYVTGNFSDNVYKIEPNGTKTQIMTSADGLNAPRGVAVDNAGNIYVAGFSNNAVYKIEPNGTKTQIITSADGLIGSNEVAVDNAGNVYVSASVSDNVYKINVPSTTTTTYSIDGTNFQASNQFTGLAPNTYTVTALDSTSGCAADTTITISEPSAITFTTTATCSDVSGADGTITVTTSGGTVPYQYSSDNGVTFQASNNVLSGLAGGTYQVVVRDANGCTTAAQAEIISICYGATSTITNLTCAGGSVFVTVSGGTAPYSDGTNTYQTDTFTISGVSTGAFSFTITDSSSQSTTIFGTIALGDLATFAIDNAIDVSCNGENDGSITILQQSSVINEIISSTDGLNGAWGIATDNAGNVYVAGFDDNEAYKIEPNGTKTQILSSTDGVSGPAGVAVDNAGNVYVAGLYSNNVYKIEPNGTKTEIFLSTDGISTPYYITTDNAGNVYVSGFASDNVYKIEPNGTKTQIISFADGLNGGMGLTVDNAGNVYVSGYFSDDVYKIEPNGTKTQIISSADGLNGGMGLTVDNAGNVYVSGYSSNDVYKIEPNSTKTQIISSADGINQPWEVATDNAGNVYVSGALSSNAYKIEPNGTKTEIVSSADGLSRSYSIAADNAGNVYVPGYLSDNVYQISEPSTLIYSIDGTNFQASNQFTGLTANTYTVTAMDTISGCTADTTVIITEPATIIFTTTSTCSNSTDGTITVTVSGGTAPYQYSSDNGVTFQASNVLTGLSIGIYQVVVQDANGCTSAAQAVNVLSCYEVNVTATTNVSCLGGSDGTATITVTGGTAPFTVNGTAYNTNPFTITGLSDGAVTFTVTDSAMYSDTASTTIVTTPDVTAPTLATQNITVYLDVNGSAMITAADVNNGTTDNCDPNPTLSVSPFMFNCSNVGANSVLFKAEDASGNVDSVFVTVTVTDSVSPTVVTQNVTVQLDINGNGSITVADIDNGSSDNCSVTSTSLDMTSFTCSNVGSNIVTLTVTDANGNTSTGTATVTVEDNVLPTVMTQNFTVQLDASGNGSITAADIDNGSTDNCGIATTSLDITSFDCSNVGANTVTLTVTDVNGNTNTSTATVTVEDNILPTPATQNITVQLDANGQATITPTEVDNGSSDNCSIASLALDVTSFDCSNIGANTVNLIVTDANGNQAQAAAQVTVEDNIAPVVNTNDITVQLDVNGQATITATQIDNGSTDNCSIVTTGLDITSFDCSNIGANTVTLTVTDANGNAASNTATVTVEDNAAPTAVTQNITVVLDENGEASITPEQVNNGSTDVCGAVTLSLDITDFTCSDLGENTVTLTATDASGNSSTTTAVVNVQDDIAPTLVCKGYEWNFDENGMLELEPEDLIENAFDNCSYTASISQSIFDDHHIGDNIVQVTLTDDAGNVTTCETIVTINFSCININSIITPNGDSKNDTWEIGCLNSLNNEVQIYNRFGQLVYQATNYTGDWSGTNTNGDELPQAAYYYVIKATIGETEQVFKGNITILKK